MTDIREHYNCLPSDEYYNTNVKYWKGTPEQMELMKSDGCYKWENIMNVS